MVLDYRMKRTFNDSVSKGHLVHGRLHLEQGLTTLGCIRKSLKFTLPIALFAKSDATVASFWREILGKGRLRKYSEASGPSFSS